MTSISIKNIHLHYGKKTVVHDVSFDMIPGRVLALVGESGSGKSTIGRAVCRLMPHDGEILFEGKDIGKLNRAENEQYRRTVQMIFQDPVSAFSPRSSVGSEIRRPLLLSKRADRGNLKEKIAEVLRRVSLPDTPEFMAQPIHQLSGGQKQRLAIGRAIAMQPQFLVADECLSALDVSVALRVLNVLRDLRETDGLGFLFITHDLAVARSFADDVIVLNKGVVVESGTTDEVLNNPQHEYTRQLVSSHPLPILSTEKGH